MDSKIDAINNLILDKHILNSLNKWIIEINVFEIAGVGNWEIRHSNILSWFLNPNKAHGLKDGFLKSFIKRALSENPEIAENIKEFDTSNIKYNEFIVKREEDNIDLLIVSKKQKIIFVIENKIKSNESKNQLKKYYNLVNDKYPDYKRVFIYLTLSGDEPSDQLNWMTADYKMVVECLEASLNLNEEEMSYKSIIIAKDYITLLRRIMDMDKELENAINEVYDKHTEAIDLIFKHKKLKNVFFDYIIDWLEINKERLEIVIRDYTNSSSNISFTTRYIRSLYKLDNKKSNKTKVGFAYEISINEERIRLAGNIKDHKTKIVNNLIDFSEIINTSNKTRKLSSKNILRSGDIASGLTREVKSIINKRLDHIFTKDIVNFETKLKKAIEKELTKDKT